MARSIRISDDLYAMASAEAAVMHRSLAQQIEHWAAIGQAVEASGDSSMVRSASIAHMRARDHERVRRGRASSDELAFIPKSWVRRAKLVVPEGASRFASCKKRSGSNSRPLRLSRRPRG